MIPEIIIYPDNDTVRNNMHMLIKIHRHEKPFRLVRSIKWNGSRNELIVSGGFRAFEKALNNTWSLFPPVFEADVWAQKIENNVAEERMKHWVGAIIWWDRSHETKDEHEARWDAFEKAYHKPYRSTPQEFISTSRDLLKESEIRRIEKQKKLNTDFIYDKTRRAAAMKLLYDHEDRLLHKALTAVGYQKVRN